jgi:hypothetical protein
MCFGDPVSRFFEASLLFLRTQPDFGLQPKPVLFRATSGRSLGRNAFLDPVQAPCLVVSHTAGGINLCATASKLLSSL